MSKYAEEIEYENYVNKKKYSKGSNSKIQKILDRIDHIETLLIRLTKAFYLDRDSFDSPPPGLTRDEISFVGESGSETEEETK
jgi:hypothetical protein|tara:strand:+ start:20 stop:268 length:249 start_codon:yes stop_codon:yes gene_type:complete